MASGNGTEETLISQPKQKVAVKVVRYVDKDALTVLMRILRGIYVWWNLAHENVAELLGITTNFDHTISIASPLIPRVDAFRYVQDPNVDPRPLILEIAKGLHYLHTYERGPIIHGGIKGANVLVSDDGHALLTDFGSSRLAEASFSLVVKGDRKGTLDWMAPEHFQADKFTMSTASDVWAFGMTTLELFTRKRPFDHLQNIGAVVNHIVNKELTRPSLVASFFRLSDEWWSICLPCLNRDPAYRARMSNVVESIRTLQTEYKVVPRLLPRDVSFNSSHH
ncbi:hypothetical protein SCLCIDRAFT_461898 [Scleroderma citrinum Foug A]|uniref:Protein kinase domain-containing protein n=1 Tax=Scleroderma citrinum Foug A TaxID=1036808 RepID=A0A0C3CX72_9AGAM|nr:hypothetical protein SCLCIDRAFT_461898 [Scleroderma citrinum Foug A]